MLFRHPEGPQAPPQGLLGGSLGGSVAALGVPWGGLGDTLGGRGDPSEATFGEQAALQNHWFYYINGYILAARGGLGGPRGKQGDDEGGPKAGEGTPENPRREDR